MSNDSSPYDAGEFAPERLKGLDLDDLTKEDLLNLPRTRAHLNQLRVVDLRHIARDECGSGTWISHASKDELIEGTLQGSPPTSVHKKDSSMDTPFDAGDTTRTIFQKYRTEGIDEENLGTVAKIVNEIVERRLEDVQRRIRHIESELGIDSGEDDAFSVGEVQRLFQKHISKSEEAKANAEEKVSANANENH